MLAVSMDTYLQQLYPEMDPNVLSVFIGVFSAMLLAGLAFSLTLYILYSYGLYAIAKRRGLYRPWLAWLPIPLCRSCVLGNITDQYHVVRKGRLTRYKAALLCAEVFTFALTLAVVITFQIVVYKTLAVEYWLNSYYNPGALYGTLIYPTQQELIKDKQFLRVICVVAMLVAGIYMIIYYKVHYDLFASCRPEQKVVFLVLSILFPVTLPFFVFACRKHDLGMQEQIQHGSGGV